MKLSKTKVVALALAVCLIAILSMGSLAWFTDDDSVTNDFLIAGSEDQNPDDVFSIDVWEDKDLLDNGEEKIQTGITYDAILPGDDLYKEANIENTGAYDQYVRAIVTVSDAHIWQQLHGEVFVPLNKIATDLNAKFETWSIEYNAAEDQLVYVLYFNEILPATGADTATLFTNIAIPEALDRYQAAEMAGGFVINVKAEAVQTEHVGDTAPKAFETVGMAVKEGKYMTTASGAEVALATTADELIAAIANGGEVALVEDVAISNKLAITKDTVIYGNGKTLSYSGSDRVIDVVNNADADVALTVKDLDIKVTSSWAERGISYNESGVLTVEDVTISGNINYGINLPGKSDNVTAVIKDTTIDCFIALNIWGENSKVQVIDSTLISTSNSSDSGAAISINKEVGNSANGTVLTITGGTLKAIYKDTSKEALAIRSQVDVVTITVSAETEVVGKISDVASVANVVYPPSSYFYSFTDVQKAIDKVVADAQGQVSLVKDVTVDTLNVDGNVALETNGYTFTVGTYTGTGVLTVDGVVVYGN